MTRATVFLWTLMAMAAYSAPPQHSPDATAAHQEASHAAHGPAHVDLWKLANFALFVGALGYLLRKKAGWFFHSRTTEIQRAMAEAARLREQAEQRCTAIEQRLANVAAEIEGLRFKAREEAAAEEARFRAQIEQDVRKIHSEAQQEIEAAVKAARRRLREQAAELAISLAALQIRQRLSPEVEERLIRETVRDFERRAPGVC